MGARVVTSSAAVRPAVAGSGTAGLKGRAAGSAASPGAETVPGEQDAPGGGGAGSSGFAHTLSAACVRDTAVGQGHTAGAAAQPAPGSGISAGSQDAQIPPAALSPDASSSAAAAATAAAGAGVAAGAGGAPASVGLAVDTHPQDAIAKALAMIESSVPGRGSTSTGAVTDTAGGAVVSAADSNSSAAADTLVGASTDGEEGTTTASVDDSGHAHARWGKSTAASAGPDAGAPPAVWAWWLNAPGIAALGGASVTGSGADSAADGADDAGDTGIQAAALRGGGDAAPAALAGLTAPRSPADQHALLPASPETATASKDPNSASVGAAGQANPGAGATVAGLSQALQMLASSAPAQPPVSQLALPVSDPRWPQALAAQVHWMAGAQVQSATLRLSPEHLGPLEVRIDLQHSQINVSFTAAHPDTRNALTEALPQLRQLLAAGGLSLGQASVQQQSHSDARPSPAAPTSGAPSGETAEPVAIVSRAALGLIDEYA